MLLRKLVFARAYLLTFFESALIAALYVAAVYLIMGSNASLYLEFEGGTLDIALVAGIFIVGSYLFDFYKRVHTRSRLVLAMQMCELIGIMLLAQAGMAFISPDIVLPQKIVILGNALTLIVLVLWRLFLYPHVWNAFGAQQVLFVGLNNAVLRLADTFQTQIALGMEVTGFVVNDGSSCPGPVLGNPKMLERVVSKTKPDRIIVSEDGADKRLLRTLFRLKAAGVNVETASHAYEALYGRVFSHALNPNDVVFRNELAARPGSLALQSIYTNLLALATTILVLPLVLLIGIAIRLTSRGRKALINTLCTGLHGVPFRMYRFRCSGRFGEWLIRSRLAGLPQAINILRGEMTLIGPRPENFAFDAELARLIPFYVQRHHVKPGIIGWSQLHCDGIRTDTTDALARIEYDLYYIKHLSLTLDAYIAIRALKLLVSHEERTTDLANMPVSHEPAR